MKRRSFIGALTAVIAAPSVLEKITQPGVDPKEFTGLQGAGDDNTSIWSMHFDECMHVRIGLPSPRWRLLNKGTGARLS